MLDDKLATAVACPPDAAIPAECQFDGSRKRHIMLPLITVFSRVIDGVICTASHVSIGNYLVEITDGSEFRKVTERFDQYLTNE